MTAGKRSDRDSDAKQLEADARAIRSKTKAPARELLSELDTRLAKYLVEHEGEENTGIRNLRVLVEETMAAQQTMLSAIPTVPAPGPPELELEPPAVTPARITLRPDERREVEPPRSRRRVLVVDDDPELLDQLVELLSDEGYRTFRASNGMQALARVAGGTLEEQIPRPDLIVLDVMMPVLNGPGFVRAIEQTEYSDIPIVLISAGGPPAETDRRFVFIPKPRIHVLLEEVRRQILDTVEYRVKRGDV
jgi:CheY-like chemotaxis protein